MRTRERECVNTDQRRATMRRIVAFDHVTADGYFSTADGQLGWTVPDAALDAEATSGSPNGNAVLFGRRTYEMFASFWPNVPLDAPDAPDPHDDGRRSAAIRRMATWLDAATKVVFSTTMGDATWRNSRVARAIEPDAIEAMKREPGGDIMIFGSGSVVSRLTALGLVDEFQLVVSPVFLGTGCRLLHALPNTVRLELVEARPYASGNVKLRYRPAAA
jgi:dihydrofolate reductase